jgi:hypothetical protein
LLLEKYKMTEQTNVYDMVVNEVMLLLMKMEDVNDVKENVGEVLIELVVTQYEATRICLSKLLKLLYTTKK